MKYIMVLIFVLLAIPARADQYDCIFKWTNIAAAKADAAAIAETLPDDQGVRQFMTDHVIAPLQVWRASQDTIDVDGNVIHSYLPGFFALISADHIIKILADDPALQICFNRDKINRNERPFIIKSNISAGILQDIRFQPIYTGSIYPFGNLN